MPASAAKYAAVTCGGLPTPPEAFAAFLQKDVARYAGIVKKIGLQPQ